MIVTVLAITFLVLLSLIAFFGYKILGNRTSTPGVVNSEKCAVCREKLPKEELVLRQIGDYKLMYFCRKCIIALYVDLGLKN